MNTNLTKRIAKGARATAVAGFIGAAALTGIAGATGIANATTPGLSGQSTMYGHPDEDAKWWARQSEGDCGLMTVAVVVGEHTGTEPSEPNILAVAEHTQSVAHPGQPIYTPAPDAQHPNDSSGTFAKDQVVLLAHYGIHGDLSNATLEDLEKALTEGRGVIAALNIFVLEGQEQKGKQEGDDPTKADHVVVVTGIDVKNGVVHLNNTGVQDGRDEQIPLAAFMKAWQTSHNTAIVTEETAS